ncbi:hypothetical protein BRC21_02125 [Candidatus Saccharibacteria bacterium SW_7_54_9]|nr:MAG: hypothetical protein BRC21_02125 [Candidatus Saccharibacteria bacterium SW_7_54_9]
MKQVEQIKIDELREMAERMYGDMVKAVVDIEQGLLVVDGEMHVDQEQYLLEAGSQQENLWGINLYPDQYGTEDFVEFDSMINLRPRQENLSRSVEDAAIRDQIMALLDSKVSS